MINIEEIKKLNNIHISWKDYTLLMLNSTPSPLRDIWQNKLISGVISAKFKSNAISEGTVAALEVLKVLPKDIVFKLCDENWENFIKKERIPGSKKVSVVLGQYPQESITFEAQKCLLYILDNWDIFGENIIMNTPLIKKIWDLSQWSKGDCLYPDEVLTYTLDKELNPNYDGNWIDASIDVFKNGRPSKRFDKYWTSDKLSYFPFTGNKNLKIRKAYFKNVIKIIFKEDILGCPSYKRIAICILKNDITFSYAGFSRTYKERIARENAIYAFKKLNKKEL